VARYGERLNPVFEHLADAQRRTGVAKAQKGGDDLRQEILERIDSALSFTETLIRQADPTLVSASRIAQLQTTIDEVGTAVEAYHPESAPDLEPADQAADRLLDTAAGLPHRSIEEAANQGKEIAKSFQRSARQRERGVRAALQSARAEAKELEQKLESAKAELASTVEERTNVLDTRATEIGSQLEAAEQGQSQLLDEQRDAFQKMQDELRADFEQKRTEQLTELDAQRTEADDLFRKTLEERSTAADEVIANLERKDADAEQLVGSISIRGTADRYEKEAKAQTAIADRWRRATVLIGLLAGLVAGSAAFLSDQEPVHVVGKLALGLLLAGVAGYTARQSAQHRRREEDASKLHLDLAAFGPFIEPLPDEAKNEERVLLGRRVFARGDNDEQHVEHGTSIKALIPRRSAAASDGEPSN